MSAGPSPNPSVSPGRTASADSPAPAESTATLRRPERAEAPRAAGPVQAPQVEARANRAEARPPVAVERARLAPIPALDNGDTAMASGDTYAARNIGRDTASIGRHNPACSTDIGLGSISHRSEHASHKRPGRWAHDIPHGRKGIVHMRSGDATRADKEPDTERDKARDTEHDIHGSKPAGPRTRSRPMPRAARSTRLLRRHHRLRSRRRCRRCPVAAGTTRNRTSQSAANQGTAGVAKAAGTGDTGV